MKTEILNWNQIDEIATILKEGGIVIFPTETVFGMGCIASSEEAYARLVETKRRQPDKPFTLMCSSLTQIAMHAEMDKNTITVMKNFMPGPITLLLKARNCLEKRYTLGQKTIGVRIPDSKEVRDLIGKVGCPLFVPSANYSGEPAVTSFEDAKKQFDGVVDAIVEGSCTDKLASTIVDLSQDEPVLVRKGPIPFAVIKETYELDNKALIALGSDHGGYTYKEAIKEHVLAMGYEVYDAGTNSLNSCDYPLFAFDAANKVASGEAKLGILVCTSGEGISMAANKIKGVRCGIGYDDIATGKTREHNNANMVAFGQAYMKLDDVLRRVDIFLSEAFSKEEKHRRRVEEIKSAE